MTFYNGLDLGVFFKEPINELLKSEMIEKNIWNKQCPVTMDRLTLLNLSYTDYDGNSNHEGKMLVFDVVADKVLHIFQELYIRRFPIYSIKLINVFDGDDNNSMAANNTSSFNCRKIANTTTWSIHSYGMAIDINPLQNPMLDTEYLQGKKSIEVFPHEGMNYINRCNIRAGMVESIIDDSTGLTVIDLFRNNGFGVWGGAWNFPVDWHHFQVGAADVRKLAGMNFEEGTKYFECLIQKK